MATTLALTPMAVPLRARLAAAWQRHRGWLWTDVVAVFLFTRVLLLALAAGVQPLPKNPYYPLKPDVATLGWQFTPVWLIDVWGRWDSYWYMDVVQNGYYARGDVRSVYSNLPFFPLFPYAVKALSALIPAALRTQGAVLLSGVLLSNALLLGGLALLRQWVAGLVGDAAVARRTVLYLLAFPTGFFFSAFYTEGAFLFFSMAALYAAQRRAWMWACLAGGLLALARPQGILIGLPLAWQYAEQAQWKLRNVRRDAVWFAALFAPLLAYGAGMYALTGDFLAPQTAAQVWSRGFAWPWETLLRAEGEGRFMTQFQVALTIPFIAVALLAVRRLPSPSLGIYALLLILLPLCTGIMTSTARYYLVAIPVFVVLAQWGRRPLVNLAILAPAVLLQIIFFVAWSLFFFVA
jgi:hypothetical protein